MKILFFILLFFIYSCGFFLHKKDKLNYSNNFKLYYYSKADISNREVCLEVGKSILKFFPGYEKDVSKLESDCTLFINVTKKKNINSTFRYTLYIDFDSFFKEFINKYEEIGEFIFLNVEGDEEVKRLFMDLKKSNNFAFFENLQNDLVDGMIKVNLDFSKIETSVGEIYSVKLENLIFKEKKMIESIVTTGYGLKQDALWSAVNEFTLKLKNLENKLKPDYVLIEFSNIKYFYDFEKIFNFLSRKFIRFKVLSINKDKLVVKVPLKKSIEEISSHLLSNIDGSALDRMDYESKKIFVILNYSEVGI